MPTIANLLWTNFDGILARQAIERVGNTNVIRLGPIPGPNLTFTGFEVLVKGVKAIKSLTFGATAYELLPRPAGEWGAKFVIPSLAFPWIKDLGKRIFYHHINLQVILKTNGQLDYLTSFAWYEVPIRADNGTVSRGCPNWVSNSNVAPCLNNGDASSFKELLGHLRGEQPLDLAVEGRPDNPRSVCELLLGLQPYSKERERWEESETKVRGDSRGDSGHWALFFQRAYTGNPASPLPFAREGRFTVEQRLNLDDPEQLLPGPGIKPSRWRLDLIRTDPSRAHLEYLDAMLLESASKDSHGFNFRHRLSPSSDSPLDSAAAPGSKDQRLPIHIEFRPAEDGSLTTDRIRLLPGPPEAAAIDGRCQFEFPSVLSREGAALSIAMTLTRPQGPPDVPPESLTDLVFDARLFGINHSGNVWFNFGSLAMQIRPEGRGGEDPSVFRYRLERDPTPAAEDKWGVMIPLRIAGFAIGRGPLAGNQDVQGSLILPVGRAEPVFVERTGGEVDFIDASEQPLLIPLDFDRSGLPPPPLSLAIRHSRFPGELQVQELRLSLAAPLATRQFGEFAPTRLLYLDRHPFLVALIEFPPLAAVDRNVGEEVAYWTSQGIHHGWQLRSTANEVTIWLPPQGIGEGMEKGRENGSGSDPSRVMRVYDLEEDEVVPMRFAPNSKLVVKTSDQNRNYGLSPTFLRTLLGGLKDHRSAGLQLVSARFEMLYGLGFEIRDAPYLRVAELFSRLGMPARPLSLTPPQQDFRDPESLAAWKAYASAWNQRLRVLESRLGIYEVFDDRQANLNANGEPTVLMLDGTQAEGPVSASLRTDADLRTSWPSASADMTGLPGSYAWAFESKVLYDALFNNDPVPFPEGRIEALKSSVTGLYFSCLGGWGTQQATFDNGRASISVTVEMGRISELRVERIGRLCIYWNKLKLVTIFRRTVLGSTQFHEQQDELIGRPVLRMAEVYVEFMEKHRRLPDQHTRTLDPSLAACVSGCSCDEKILVDPRWGTDVYRRDANGNRQPHGMKLPLMAPGANRGIYGKSTVLLHLHSDPKGLHAEDTGRIVNLEDLAFWSDVSPELDDDTDKWPPVYDIDVGTFNPADFETLDKFTAESLGAPAIAAGASAFTFRLEGLRRGGNLVSHLDAGGEVGKPRPQVESLLRTVTIARGCIPLSNEGDKALNQLRKDADSIRALAGSFLDCIGQIRDGLEPGIGIAITEATRALLIEKWGAIVDVLNNLPNTIGIPEKADVLNDMLLKARWALERGGHVFHHLLDLSSWPAEELVVYLKQLRDAGSIEAVAKELLGRVEGTVEYWGSRLSILKAALAAVVVDNGKKTADEAERIIRQLKENANVRAAIKADSGGVFFEVSGIFSLSMESFLSDLKTELMAGKGKIFTDRMTGLVAGMIGRISSGTGKSRLRQLYEEAIAAYRQLNADTAQAPSHWQRFAIRAQDVLDSEMDRVTALLGKLSPDAFIGAIKERARRAINDLDQAVRAEIGKPMEISAEKLQNLQRQILHSVEPWMAAVRLQGGVRTAAEAAITPALQTFRAFGRVPDVPRLGFEGAALKGGDYLDALKHRFQSAAFNFLTDEKLRVEKVREAYKALAEATVENATKAGEEVRKVILRAGKQVTIEPPITAIVDQAKSTAGAYLDEARLKAASIRQEVNGIKDKLLADTKALAEKSLGGIFPDFGALKLEKLLGYVGVSEGLANEIARKTKITHGFNRQTMSGFIDCVVEPIALGGTKKLFDIAGCSLQLKNPVLQARVRVETEAGGEVQKRSEHGTITADWELKFGKDVLVTFKKSALRCENGRIRMDLDPKHIELSSFLKALSDVTRGAQLGGGGKPFQAGVQLEPMGITCFCRLRLQVPNLGGGVFAITNLAMGAFFEVSVVFSGGAPFTVPTSPRINKLPEPDPARPAGRLADDDLRLCPEGFPLKAANQVGFGAPYFRIATGLNFASREAPFILTVFVLGGGGWFSVNTEYFISLENSESAFTSYMTVGLAASASLRIDLGFASGGVFVELSVSGTWMVAGSGSSRKDEVTVALKLGGYLDLLGIITVRLEVILAVTYHGSNGGMSGSGEIKVKIRICWCFTLTVERGFTYKFGKARQSSGNPTLVAGLDPAQFPALPSSSSVPLPTLFGDGNAIPDLSHLAAKRRTSVAASPQLFV